MDCTCPQPKNLQYLCQHKSPNRGRALRPYDFDEPGEQQSSNKTQHEMSPDRDPTSRHSAPFSCRVPRPRTGTRRPERKRTKELGVRLLESISFSLVSVFSFLEDLEQGGILHSGCSSQSKKNCSASVDQPDYFFFFHSERPGFGLSRGSISSPPALADAAGAGT